MNRRAVCEASGEFGPARAATREQIEEERRLFYVALTRAKDWLYVCFPQKYFHAYRGRSTDQFGYAQLSRFLQSNIKEHFVCSVANIAGGDDLADGTTSSATCKNIRQQVRALWS